MSILSILYYLEKGGMLMRPYTPFKTLKTLSVLDEIANAKPLQALALAIQPIKELGLPYGVVVLNVLKSKTNAPLLR
jgi:hypothetical protein